MSGVDDLIMNGVVNTEISEEQQESLQLLGNALHELWALGETIVLSWCYCEDDNGLDVLLVPHSFLGEFTEAKDNDKADPLKELNREFLQKLISGNRKMLCEDFYSTAERFDLSPKHIPLFSSLSGPIAEAEIEKLVRRYSISYVAHRAAILIDIVDFSLFSPFEQASQLNSLSFSLNSAYSRMLKKGIEVDFARTTTGDGFYVWNRDASPKGNMNLFQLMLMTVADNTIAKNKATGATVPTIRTGFHIGPHYEFYQSEGVSPTLFSYIVGDLTIELARMLESAGPEQIIMGDFTTELLTSDTEAAYLMEFTTVKFVERARRSLNQLQGLLLGGEEIRVIHSYLSGETGVAGGDNIRRVKIVDKHGRSRDAFNLRANVRMSSGGSIILGVPDYYIPNEDVLQKEPRRARIQSQAQHDAIRDMLQINNERRTDK